MIDTDKLPVRTVSVNRRVMVDGRLLWRKVKIRVVLEEDLEKAKVDNG